MKTKNISIKAVILAVVAMMAIATVIPALSDESDASSSITVTDGKGNEITFDEVPDYIMTIGKGVTATAIEIGVLDKVVVCDSYSYKASDSVYSALKEKVDSGKIKANGNVYSSGKSDLLTDIIDTADTEKGGVFDKTSDAVFITGSDTYITSIISTLKDYGFTKILAWNDITDYTGIADFVRTVSLVSKGSVDDSVNQMENLSDVISSKLRGVEKRDAFYVTYSGGEFKVGNTGSLANSMIIAAGGNSVTMDSSKSGSTYGVNLTDLVSSHPDAVIFVDSSLYNSETNYSAMKTQIGSAVKNVVPLQSLWNNYCVESMDGVWTMACAMYPDIFSGDVPKADTDSSDNTLLYVGAAVIAVVVIAAAGFIFLKKH